MSKKVAIVGYRNEGQHFGVQIPYLDFASKIGDIKILMPGEGYTDDIDLLILPGGMDLRSDTYKQVPSFKAGHTDVFKQYFFDHKLAEFVENKVPIFGICLGFQQLASFFGGELIQNLRKHPYSVDREDMAHEIHLSEVGKKMFNLANAKAPKKLEVNSLHHQGLPLSKFPGELELIASANNEDDSKEPIAEAFIHKVLPIAGVQWHPEEIHDITSALLINFILGESVS